MHLPLITKEKVGSVLDGKLLGHIKTRTTKKLGTMSLHVLETLEN